jgi:hypothetical protein
LTHRDHRHFVCSNLVEAYLALHAPNDIGKRPSAGNDHNASRVSADRVEPLPKPIPPSKAPAEFQDRQPPRFPAVHNLRYEGFFPASRKFCEPAKQCPMQCTCQLILSLLIKRTFDTCLMQDTIQMQP